MFSYTVLSAVVVHRASASVKNRNTGQQAEESYAAAGADSRQNNICTVPSTMYCFPFVTGLAFVNII